MGLSVGIIPSLAIGIAAYGAGELLFHNYKGQKIETKSLEETLLDARNKNLSIKKIISLVEDEELKENIKQINFSIDKIINAVEKNPEKYKIVDNFFSYYLPVTINILNKYDEIENQKLSSKESDEFMKKTKSMINKINLAFKNQLSNLYQSDIIDTDAEMKVFESMLKSDGYDDNNLNIK